MSQSTEEILDELLLPVSHSYDRKKADLGRPLTAGDMLAYEKTPKARQQPLQRLRSSHHFIAKLLAQGETHQRIALITGCSPTTVSCLKRDPAFQELLSHYRGVIDEVFINVHERLASLSIDALEVIHERLLESPDNVKTEELIKLLTAMLDRTGYGPTSTQNHNIKGVILTDETLSRIKAEATSGRVVRTLSSDSGSSPGAALPTSKEIHRNGAPARGESSGPDLREEIHSDAEEETPRLRATG